MNGVADTERAHWFWSGEPETPATRQPEPDVGRREAGLARAFLDPPYRLRGPRSEWNTLFFDVLDEVCGGLGQPVEIYAWNPDASNFFDAGKEWWGCYFWTLHPARSDRYVLPGLDVCGWARALGAESTRIEGDDDLARLARRDPRLGPIVAVLPIDPEARVRNPRAHTFTLDAPECGDGA